MKDTKELLLEVTNRLTQSGKPMKIILFGSRARKDFQTQSDFDFLIVEKSKEPRYKRAAKYRRSLKDIGFSKDIVVWTPDEIDEWSGVSNSFIATVLREGIVLYER